MGKPASMMSTPSRASCAAMRIFSSMFMENPGDCSPSRRVVSKNAHALCHRVSFVDVRRAKGTFSGGVPAFSNRRHPVSRFHRILLLKLSRRGETEKTRPPRRASGCADATWNSPSAPMGRRSRFLRFALCMGLSLRGSSASVKHPDSCKPQRGSRTERPWQGCARRARTGRTRGIRPSYRFERDCVR